MYNYKVQEPIFRHLQGLDEQLSRMARNYLFLCQTPWKIDLFKTTLIKEEFGSPWDSPNVYSEVFVGLSGVIALARTQTFRNEHIPRFLLGSAEDHGEGSQL